MNFVRLLLSFLSKEKLLTLIRDSKLGICESMWLSISQATKMTLTLLILSTLKSLINMLAQVFKIFFHHTRLLDSKNKFVLPFQKNPAYSFILVCSFMNFQKKCQSACLFQYARLLGTSEYMIDYQITNMANTFLPSQLLFFFQYAFLLNAFLPNKLPVFVVGFLIFEIAISSIHL